MIYIYKGYNSALNKTRSDEKILKDRGYSNPNSSTLDQVLGISIEGLSVLIECSSVVPTTSPC